MMIFERVVEDAILPKRSTLHSAGYDLHITEDALLMPNETKLFGTGVTFKMMHDVYVEITSRSGLALKQGVIVKNAPGIIDADYYPHEIKVMLWNTSDKPIRFKKGDRVAQAIIKEYFITMDDDFVNGEQRTGGFGSTGVESGEA